VDGTLERSDVAGLLMRLDQLQWLPDDVLAKADRASMRVSLEVRTPFLSRDLVEFAASIPAALHMTGGGKRILRACLARVLPDAARRRPKRAFRVPAADWLRGPLRPALDAQIAGGSAFDEGWFSRDAVSTLAAEHCTGRSDRSDVLWPILAFGLWLDRVRGEHAG
jgi:asparagine synthase (glutamine-hydrolysing)